jgi:enoyl-CoA hydratase
MTPHTGLEIDRDGGILVMTLARPDVRNAIDHRLAVAVSKALDELDADSGLSVGIITGAGGYFCSGMDLRAFARGELPRVEKRGFAGITSQPSHKPLIAAVEGGAVAGGFEIVLACDLVVASKEATFGLPEVRRGLAAGAGGLLRLQHRLPLNLAMELVITGAPTSATTLHQFGLVNRLVAAGEALSAARELGHNVARNGPLAVTASKSVLSASSDWPLAEAFMRQEEIIAPVRSSSDAAEGARAFLEKRAARFTGT